MDFYPLLIEIQAFLVAQIRIYLQCGRPGLYPWEDLGRSPGEGNGYPLQYSGLENSMDRGAWQVTVYGITKSWTRLSDFHFHLLRYT